MHILYLHQYFCTRGGYNRHALVRVRQAPDRQGPPGHDDVLRPRDPGRLPPAARQGVHGARCRGHPRRLPSPPPTATPPPPPAWAASSACSISCISPGWQRRVGKQLPRPDVVFATHTPLTIGLAGMRARAAFRRAVRVRGPRPVAASPDQLRSAEQSGGHLVAPPNGAEDLPSRKAYCRPIAGNEGRRRVGRDSRRKV